MDIDQRLDRLTERHEAMAQTVEMLSTSVIRLEGLSEKNEVRMAQFMETMTRLGNIAIAHEERFEDLDGRLDDIEGKS
jgi:uncharacterized coiled-coil protein SlyX